MRVKGVVEYRKDRRGDKLVRRRKVVGGDSRFPRREVEGGIEIEGDGRGVEGSSGFEKGLSRMGRVGTLRGYPERSSC